MKKLIITLIVSLSVFAPILPVDAAVKKAAPKPKVDPITQLRRDYEAKVKELQAKLDELTKKVAERPTVVSGGAPTITAQDIAPYLQSVALIVCDDGATGSGTFVKYTDGWAVLTNLHVVENRSCIAIERGYNDKGLQAFTLSDTYRRWNVHTDIATAAITGAASMTPSASTDYLSQTASGLTYCSANAQLGAPVAVIGYPLSGQDNFVSRRIVTTGVIAGLNYSTSENLPYVNYYISAKADSGNSGGMVLGKEDNTICMMGVMTWVKMGNYDNLGVIQGI